MKVLKIVGLAALALCVVGCGKKLKLPEGTIAAAYVDLGKARSAGEDIAKMIIKHLPKKVEGMNVREEAEKAYEKGYEQFEEMLKSSNLSLSSFKWLAVSVGDADNPADGDSFALAACVEGVEKLPLEARDEKLCGETLYSGESPFSYVVVYDKSYVLAAGTKEMLEKLVQTYKGEKDCSSNFDDLADLSGSAIARIQVDGISELLENPKLAIPSADGKKTPAEAIRFAMKDVDEDLGDYLTELESLTLDINVGEDDVGVSFAVACGSSDAAELVEQAFGTLAIFARVGIDAAVVSGLSDFGDLSDLVGGLLFEGVLSRREMKELRNIETLKVAGKLFAEVGQNIEVDRSGSEASIRFSIPLSDIVDDVCDAFEKDSEKIMKLVGSGHGGELDDDEGD